MHAERTAVVVGAYRRGETLERCLTSLQNMAEHPEDLIFVDNGSKDGLATWVHSRFPRASVVRLEQNLLYCGGYNAGIKEAIAQGYDYVLILNADTEVVNLELLTHLVEAAQRWPQAAFIGPLVYFRSRGVVQKTWLKFPKVFRGALIWLPWRLAPAYFLRQPAEESEVEFLNGVCMLCRVSALKEFGLMDDRLGGYVEDADWSWRSREQGWTSVFIPVPSIIHHEEPVGYEPYSMKTFLLKRNTVFWYLKVGWRSSAYTYAYASLSLARLRLLSERSMAKREMHRYFIQKLEQTYRGLLHGDSLGEWFGPPLGNWDTGLVNSSWI